MTFRDACSQETRGVVLWRPNISLSFISASKKAEAASLKFEEAYHEPDCDSSISHLLQFKLVQN